MKKLIVISYMILQTGVLYAGTDYVIKGTESVTIKSEFPIEKRQARRDFLTSDIANKTQFMNESQARADAARGAIIEEQKELDDLNQVEAIIIANKSDILPPTDIVTPSFTLVNQPLSVILKWGASTDDRSISGYNIYRDGALLSFVVGLIYFDPTVHPAKTYEYGFEAVDSSGNKSNIIKTIVDIP